MDLTAGQVRHVRIEKRRQGAQDAAFRLSAQAEKNEVVARQDRVDDLRDHRVLVADDALENLLVTVFAQPCRKIVAEFVLHAPGLQTLFSKWTMAQFAECARKTHEGNPQGQRFSRLYAGWKTVVGRSSLVVSLPAFFSSTRVAVAAGFFAGMRGAAQFGEHGFQILGERSDALTLTAEREQLLFEV